MRSVDMLPAHGSCSSSRGFRVFEKEPTLSCSFCRASEATNTSAKDGMLLTMMRCSRCKIAQYCSRECQNKAHPTHKRACTRYAKLLKKQFEPSLQAYQHEHNVDGVPWNDEGLNIDPYTSFLVCSPTYSSEYREYMTSPVNSERLADPYVKTKLELGRIAFHMAYRSCDIPERGRYGLEIALRHFLELMRFHDFGVAVLAEGFVIAILMALGHDDEAGHLFRWQGNSLLYELDIEYEVDETLPYRALQLLCPRERDGWIYDWLMDEDQEAVQRVKETTKSLGMITIETEDDLMSISSSQDHAHCVTLLFILRIRRLASLRRSEQQVKAFLDVAHRVMLNERGVLAHIREFIVGDGDLKEKEAKLMGQVREAAAACQQYWRFLRCEAVIDDDESSKGNEFGPLLQDCIYLFPGASEVLYEFTDNE